MLRTIAVCIVGIVAGCKGKSAATGGGSAAGSGSAVAVVTADAGAPSDVAAPPVLGIDPHIEDPGLLIAFDKQVPQLPAISADGKTIATLAAESDPMSPSPVSPWDVEFAPIADGKTERITIVEQDMIDSATLTDEGEWKNAPVAELRKRAAAVKQKLAQGGYSSLVHVDLAITSGGDPLPTKIGSFTLKMDETEDRLDLSLVDGSGKAVHRETVKSFTDGEWDTGMGKAACNYRPTLNDVYQDAAKRHLYVTVGFRWQEMCGGTETKLLVWEMPAPSAADAAAAADLDAVTKLFAGELDALEKKDAAPFATDAQIFSQQGLGTRDAPAVEIVKDRKWGGLDLAWGGHEDREVEVRLAADGKSAWASATAAVTMTTKNANRRVFDRRVSSVLAKTQAGWRIVATMFSEPVDNKLVNDAAKAGTWKHATYAGTGDAAVQAAFAKLVASGLDATAAANPDLVTIGSADGERTVGGGKLAKAWNAAWKGKANVTSSVAGIAPSGTTGWVGATIELPKKGYKVPFYVFCVFDKAASGEWTLVHMHLAV